MAQHGANLQSHTLELVSCLQQLQQQRAVLAASLREEEAERAKLQQDAAVLHRRLAQLDGSLEKKAAAREAFDRVIGQTESSLAKIVESSHMLLTVTKQNAAEVASMPAAGGGCKLAG